MTALSQCSKIHLSTKDMSAPEADIILAIRHTLKTHGIKGNFNFVQDHQDDDRKFSALDIEGKYNVLCVEYATSTVAENHPSQLPYPGSCAMIKVNGQWITSNIEQKLAETATTPAIKEYTMEKFNWIQEDYDRVDWMAIKQGHKGLI